MLTDTNGMAIFTSVTSGSHTVSASKTGYTSQTKSITVSANTSVDFSLVPGQEGGNELFIIMLLIAAVAVILIAGGKKK